MEHDGWAGEWAWGLEICGTVSGRGVSLCLGSVLQAWHSSGRAQSFARPPSVPLPYHSSLASEKWWRGSRWPAAGGCFPEDGSAGAGDTG